MASESREDPRVGVDVPAELHDWLDERAASLGVERTELVAQILSSYHAAATLDGQLDATGLLDLDAEDFVDVETAVEETVADTTEEIVEERVEAALDERLSDAIESRLDARAEDLSDEIASQVRSDVAADRQSAIDDLDSEFQAKIDDVRERVIQVKQETDTKAAATHTHEEFETIDALDARVNDLAGELDALRDEFDTRFEDDDGATEEAMSELTDRVDDVSEKLNRVAWVVSDLKDETSGRDAHEQAVDRIKRAAAQESVSTATCERCEERVEIGLLTDPECPHCNATVSDVRPTGGLLRKKARLVAASQLESGDDDA